MIAQTLLNTVVATAALVPVAVDVFLCYRLFRFFPFTTAATFCLAPYLLASFGSVGGHVLGTLAALAIVLGLGALGGVFFARHSRGHVTASLQLFLISLGILVLVQNVVSVVFGRQPEPLEYFAFLPSVKTSIASLTGVRIGMILWGIIAYGLVGSVFRFTDLGLKWRGIANDPELAEISGISPSRTLPFAFCLGSLLTCGAGILHAADTAMTPHMGLRAFMLAVVVVIVGGARLSGVLLGCIIVAAAQNIGGIVVGNRWQDIIVFVLLLLFMAFRPFGLLTSKPVGV